MPEPGELAFGELTGVTADQFGRFIPPWPGPIEVGQQFSVSKSLSGLSAQRMGQFTELPHLLKPAGSKHFRDPAVDPIVKLRAGQFENNSGNSRWWRSQFRVGGKRRG